MLRQSNVIASGILFRRKSAMMRGSASNAYWTRKCEAKSKTQKYFPKKLKEMDKSRMKLRLPVRVDIALMERFFRVCIVGLCRGFTGEDRFGSAFLPGDFAHILKMAHRIFVFLIQ
jgi:hypothetical protein